MAAKKTLFMETTEVTPERTAGEITACLVSAGATGIGTEYDGKGKITGLTWKMMVGPDPQRRVERVFSMPARVEPVYQILVHRRSSEGDKWYDQKLKDAMRAKAERIAWRQLLRWVQAQMAMIDAGMSEAGEIFFPYMLVGTATTAYGFFAEKQFPMLEAGKPQ